MTGLPFYVVDSFTRTPFAGNPAGVVLADAPLADDRMLAIAGELHLESAFLSPAPGPDADYQVAYCTGAARVPLCGHDTIALAAVLAQTGRLPSSGTVRLLTDVGPLSVSVTAEGEVTMDQSQPVFGPTVSAADAADALGLPVSEITDTDLPVQIVSTGLPFLVVPVAHQAPISALAPDGSALLAFGDGLDEYINGFYVWTRETDRADAQIHARCFCPAIGLPEDPVTGTASGAAGAYLARHGVLSPDAGGVLTFRTEQGYAMGRPGNVTVRLETDGTDIARVQVSGYAVIVGEGTLRV